MKAAYEHYEQIERYLTGELPAGELAAFENRLEADALLREEVQAHRAVHELVVDQGLLELKAKMKAYEAGYTGSNSGVQIVSTIVMVLSLSAIGLITSDPLSSAPAPVVKTEPENVSPAPAAPNAVIQAAAPAPVIISSISAPVTVPDITTTVIADTVSPPQSQALSDDTVIFKKRFSDEILLKDAMPEVPQALLPTVKMPDVVPCRLDGSLLKVDASESCTTSPTGTIIVDKASLFEGTPPLEFSIDGKNYTPGYAFSNLYPGTYYLSVRDARGCSWFEAKEITVGEKDCSTHEYSFYPDKGEVWKLPVPATSSGEINIYSRNGSRVYTGTITRGHPDHWDGTSNGHPLPMGSYSFVLKADGKVITGYVTLFK